MTNFTTLLTRSLLTNKNNLNSFEQVVNELFRTELEDALNEVLSIELSAFLDYDKYERSDNNNYRNGYSQRTIETSYGPLQIKMPRDRLGEFYTALLPKYSRTDGFLDDKIIKMFQLGMTNSDITSLCEDVYGKKYSKQTVSNITDKVITHIEAFQKRRLETEYTVVYIDATMMSLRRDTVAKEAVHIAIGITLEGTKEILGYAIAPTESATQWEELILNFKERGMERVSLFCTDGLHGMEGVINKTYPEAKIQRCIVHICRNISQKVRVSDRANILNDFKAVYTSATKEQALSQMKVFENTWSKRYPKVIESLENNLNLFTYYDYPSSVRSSIYTTNIIEGYNKQLKRKFKAKEQFPTETSMEKYLVSQFEIYNEKNMNRVHRGFKKTTRADWFKD